MFRDLRLEPGPWESKSKVYAPMTFNPVESDLKEYRVEDEHEESVARKPRQEPKPPGTFPHDRNILHRGGSRGW